MSDPERVTAAAQHRHPAGVGALSAAASRRTSCLPRNPDKAAVLAAQGAFPVSVSLFDPPALAAAFAGHDAVVNLATAMPSTARFVVRRAWRATERVRREGSAAVVDAALAAGVGRVVQESVAMLYRDHGAGWIDEDAPVDRYPATTGNHAAEASARRFAAAGGTGTVLRFGLVYGPTPGSAAPPAGRPATPVPGTAGSRLPLSSAVPLAITINGSRSARAAPRGCCHRAHVLLVAIHRPGSIRAAQRGCRRDRGVPLTSITSRCGSTGDLLASNDTLCFYA